MTTRISLEIPTTADIEAAIDTEAGWCTSCMAFTNDDIPKDAEHRQCDSCGNHDVIGAEKALLFGYFTLEVD